MADSFFGESDLIISCREWLQSRGVPADDIPDDEVIPRVRAYMMVNYIPVVFPGRRALRGVTTAPDSERLTPGQIREVDSSWVHYRRLVRAIPPGCWPAGLPRPPKPWTRAGAGRREVLRG